MANTSREVMRSAEEAIVDFGLVAYSTSHYLQTIQDLAAEIVRLNSIIQFKGYKAEDNTDCEATATSDAKLWLEQYPIERQQTRSRR